MQSVPLSNAEINAISGPVCYLLCLERPLAGHAKHYLGYTTNLANRIADHRAGMGAKIMAACGERGIDFVVARVWTDGSRTLERQLKRWNKGPRHCPICRAKQHALRFQLRLPLFTRAAR